MSSANLQYANRQLRGSIIVSEIPFIEQRTLPAAAEKHADPPPSKVGKTSFLLLKVAILLGTFPVASEVHALLGSQLGGILAISEGDFGPAFATSTQHLQSETRRT